MSDSSAASAALSDASDASTAEQLPNLQDSLQGKGLTVISDPHVFQRTTAALRRSSRPLVLVPTMGALHAGHRSLIRTARRIPGAIVMVSVFVNPAQFDNPDDLDKYPRTLEADLAAIEAEGAAIAFLPTAETMYPKGVRTTVEPSPVAQGMEGARDGHFRGVATVVTKLLQLSHATDIIMGEKDYQQLVIIQQLVTDLNLGVKVHGVPIVREADGLALSSRNVRLNPDARETAIGISAALVGAAAAGAKGPDAVAATAREILAAGGIDPIYVEVRDVDLGPAPQQGSGRILIAAEVGGVRLIDNAPVELGPDVPNPAHVD